MDALEMELERLNDGHSVVQQIEVAGEEAVDVVVDLHIRKLIFFLHLTIKEGRPNLNGLPIDLQIQ